MTATALDLIRSETAPLHARLEERLDIFSHLAEPARRAALMGRFWGFYAPVEEALAGALGPTPGLDYDARRKAPTLERDLAALGVYPRDLERFVAPFIPDQAQALGFQYVLEGSTLGGRVIRKQAALRGLAGGGLAFFDVYGADTGARWRTFLDVLEAHCAGSAVDAARGARRGFELIEAWLCREVVTA